MASPLISPPSVPTACAICRTCGQVKGCACCACCTMRAVRTRSAGRGMSLSSQAEGHRRGRAAVSRALCVEHAVSTLCASSALPVCCSAPRAAAGACAPRLRAASTTSESGLYHRSTAGCVQVTFS